jgi:hypothetical protein
MQAPPHTIDVQDRHVPVPVPSQLELELRCRMMEIDRRIEIQRSDEYRRMMFAMVGGGSGHCPGQLLPVPVPEQEIRPVPGPMVVWGSSSSPSMVRGHPAALPDLPDPHGAVAQAGPATCLALPSSLVPSSSSSQLSDGSSSSRRGHGRGRGDRGRAGHAGSSTRRHLVCILSSGCFCPHQLTCSID